LQSFHVDSQQLDRSLFAALNNRRKSSRDQWEFANPQAIPKLLAAGIIHIAHFQYVAAGRGCFEDKAAVAAHTSAIVAEGQFLTALVQNADDSVGLRAKALGHGLDREWVVFRGVKPEIIECHLVERAVHGDWRLQLLRRCNG